MTLHVKNMVCNRCIMAVDLLLKEMGFRDYKVALGLVELKEEQLNNEKKEALKEKLEDIGFELIDDRKGKLIEAIKNFIIQKIHHDLQGRSVNWSDLIADKVHYEYKYLSRLFSSVEGITIEQFIIHQKIERTKELLIYDELTLSEIAFNLGYSSVAHLSNQFKTVTGMTPKSFKQIGAEKRKPLDQV